MAENSGSITPVLSPPVVELPGQKAGRIKLRYIAFTKGYDSIRNLRSRMDIIANKEVVDDFYYLIGF